jgi:hypothetical protein
MLLRPSKLYNGYFLELNKGQIQRNHHEFSSLMKTNKKKYFPSICKNELKALNYLILKRLTSSSRKSPLIEGKTVISNQFFRYLIDRYSIKNKFVDGSKILSDHFLLTKRFFNETDYCTIYTNQYGENSFKLRITKPRRFNFFINAKLEKKQLFFKNMLHFQFCVDDRKNF